MVPRCLLNVRGAARGQQPVHQTARSSGVFLHCCKSLICADDRGRDESEPGSAERRYSVTSACMSDI